VAVLPIYFDDLEASLKATMIFPREPAKAECYAAWLIVRRIDKALDTGSIADRAALDLDGVRKRFVEVARQASDFAYIFEEARNRLRAGIVVGAAVNCLWALISEEIYNASWKRAVLIAEKLAGRTPISRTKIYSQLRWFGPVLHLLGARANLNRTAPDLESVLKISCHPDYSREDDVRFFATSAEVMHVVLCEWDMKHVRRRKDSLVSEMMDLTGDWRSAPRRDVRPLGAIKGLALDDSLAQEFARKTPGRKRAKSLSK
jgi:hypothetical protein